ncbi:MAG: cytidylyltransferase domain-containing protein [Candidatus Nanopelagicales bacterium]
MKVLGLIPARGGSKGVPGKNLRRIGGMTLVEWTARSALTSSLDRLVISTDSQEIADEARRVGVDVPFIRPNELAQDSSLTIDVVQHALDELKGDWDAVMILQPTSPFRTASDIDTCIEMLADSAADSVISVTPVGDHHPARMKFIENGFLIDPPFSEDVEGRPRQSLQSLFLRNGAIYLTRTEVVNGGSIKGASSMAYVMPEERSANIDTEFDLMVAEAISTSIGTL